MEIQRVQELLKSFHRKRLLVIGDMMLDEFIWGKVSRISPEAPVPVVEVTGESAYPGGAANVARNLKEFCHKTYVMGVVGNDRHGLQLRTIMSDLGLDLRCLFDDDNYKTIVKTRIVARQQQMVRVDREELRSPTKELMGKALKALQKLLPQIDAVIFEDYAKGLLGQEFVTQATKLIVAAGKIVTADPNPKNPLHWNGLTAIKPNRSEAFRCAGVVETDPETDFTKHSQLHLVSQRLLEKWQSEYLLITLGEHGMVLFERDAEPFHIPTRAQEVYDVSGAGDTAIALFTLALAADATPREAAEISNHASSVVVGKLGTATLTSAELLNSFERHGPTTYSQSPLLRIKKTTFPILPESPVVRATPRSDSVEEIKPVSWRTVGQTSEPVEASYKTPIPYEGTRPAVFLDRDGTLMEEVEYCSKPQDVHVFSNVPHSLLRLKNAGFWVIVITNQAGIGRGYFTWEEYQKVQAEFLRQVGPRLIDATYFCPDHPDQATHRRKPDIGMIQEASEKFLIDMEKSWFIGDKASDIECGQNAGIRTILVATGYGKNETCKPTHRARDIASAVDWIVIE